MTVMRLATGELKRDMRVRELNPAAAKLGTDGQLARPNLARRHPLAPATSSKLIAPVVTANVAVPRDRRAATVVLSDRALATIICAFLSLMVVAGIVLVTQFLAISADPSLDSLQQAPAMAAPLSQPEG